MQGSADSEEHLDENWGHNEGGESELARLQRYERKLPTVEEIFLEQTIPREFTNRGLRSQYRRVHGRVVAQTVENCREDAWEGEDCVAKAKTRIAWIEEAMFAKCVLGTEKRGMKSAQAYAKAKNKLDRWEQGERTDLWDELQPKNNNKKGKPTEKAVIQRVMSLAEKGKAGKAIMAAVSLGLAHDTLQVQQIFESKFPERKNTVVSMQFHCTLTLPAWNT